MLELKWGYKRWYVLLLLAVSVVFFGGCKATVPKIPAKGLMLGEFIETTVDSEIARYYLEDYRQNNNSQAKFDEKINTTYRQYVNRPLSREDLKTLSAETSVDFAGLFWASHLYQDAKNRRIQDLFQSKLSVLRRGKVAPLVISNADCCILLFVPGWDYVKSGWITGADLVRPLRIAKDLSLDSVFVAIHPHGGVKENARVISQKIQSLAISGKSILLVGPSSAGPAIHWSLAQLPADTQKKVKAWVNLAGILQGTPLVDYYQKWPRSWLLSFAVWWENWEKEKVLSLSMERSRRRFETLNLPQDLLVVNYIGLSLSGDITALAAERYAMLRSEGPNDGFTLLPDSIAPKSRTIVALRSDHFFNEDPEIALKTIALMQVLFESLTSGRP